MPEPPKKPGIYLLVILPIFVGGGIWVVAGLVAAYAQMAGIQKSSVPNLNGLLISLPALCLWIPVALLLAICVLFVVPPLRRVAEKYSAEAQRPHFRESQRQLGKIALIMALVCVPLIVLGFVL
jgi:hypothetical protein